MAKAKLGRAALLRMEADLAELEEQFDELKRARPRCKACGRLEVVRGKSKLEEKLTAAKVELRLKREAFRIARGASIVVVEEAKE